MVLERCVQILFCLYFPQNFHRAIDRGPFVRTHNGRAAVSTPRDLDLRSYAWKVSSILNNCLVVILSLISLFYFIAL